MKKIIAIVGVGVVLVIGLYIFLKQGLPQSNNLTSNDNGADVAQDVCAEFPKEWVQTVIGKNILKTDLTNKNGSDVCRYFVNDNDFVILRRNELSFETQKQGQQTLGRTITTNDQIKINHFVAVQEDKLINAIVLELKPNLFLTVDRSSLKAASEDEIVALAISVASRIQNGDNQVSKVAPTSGLSQQPSNAVVPLPQESDIVNNFFQLIAEHKPSDAVMMMSKTIVDDDSTKQAYGVQFNAMTSLKVVKIEPSSVSDWTDSQHQYMVILDVVMDPSSANGPIPYYGYDKGENIRFINLVKEANQWKIDSISTGP